MAATKNTSKKTSKKAPAKNTPAAKPSKKMAGVPTTERRANLVKTLRKRRATSARAAVSLETLVGDLGYTRFDVYGLIAGTSGKAGSNPNCLLSTGHVKTAVNEEVRGLSVYLTDKGKKTKFKDRPFVVGKKTASK